MHSMRMWRIRCYVMTFPWKMWKWPSSPYVRVHCFSKSVKSNKVNFRVTYSKFLSRSQFNPHQLMMLQLFFAFFSRSRRLGDFLLSDLECWLSSARFPPLQSRFLSPLQETYTFTATTSWAVTTIHLHGLSMLSSCIYAYLVFHMCQLVVRRILSHYENLLLSFYWHFTNMQDIYVRSLGICHTHVNDDCQSRSHTLDHIWWKKCVRFFQ